MIYVWSLWAFPFFQLSVQIDPQTTLDPKFDFLPTARVLLTMMGHIASGEIKGGERRGTEGAAASSYQPKTPRPNLQALLH